MITAVTKAFEGRLPAPGWRHLSRLRELYFRFRIWLGLFRRDRGDLSDRFCSVPFENIEAHENGSVFLCCPHWLPTAVGDVSTRDGADIWNSLRAQEIRRGILDGTFKHCNRTLCPSIVSGSLPTRTEARRDAVYRDIIDNQRVVVDRRPKLINLTNDRSCNLSCPSCRTRRLNFATGPAYELRKRLQDRIVQAFFAAPTDEEFVVNVTGSGDPFASRVFREFLYDLDKRDFPNLGIQLQTNGTLFNEKTWKKLNKIHGSIRQVAVSFDAATPEVYAITRRGGSWYHLNRNAEFLAGLRREGKLGNLRFDFVVQLANFRDMLRFVHMGKRLGVDAVSFSQAVNWGTWSAAEYQDVCVWNPGHPDHAEFQEIMSDPVLDDPIVMLGNMSTHRVRHYRHLVNPGPKGQQCRNVRPSRRRRA